MSHKAERKATAASGAVGMCDNSQRYRIVPVGSGPFGWAIERDGKIWRTGPSVEKLGAWLDAILAGASTYDADDIAKVIDAAAAELRGAAGGVQADRPPRTFA